MGAGKTTVAGLLGRALGHAGARHRRRHRGADGRSISDIFVDSGEQHFRALERAAVAAALAEHDGVLALGGGAVLDPDTRDAAGRPPGGVPARRPHRRGQAGRPRHVAAAAARQRARPDQGAARRAHAGLRVGRHRHRRHRRAHPRGGRRRDRPGRWHERRPTRCSTSAARRRTTSWSGTGCSARVPERARRGAGPGGAGPRRPAGRPRPAGCATALAEHYDVLPLPVPDGEEAKTAAVAAGLLGGARGGRVHPLRRGRDRRRGSDHRPRRLRRRDLAARRPGRARADHAAGHGRRGGRRQDRHQHRRRQEPRRLLPRARRRAVRPGAPRHAAARPSWSPGWARSSSAASSPTP